MFYIGLYKSLNTKHGDSEHRRATRHFIIIIIILIVIIIIIVIIVIITLTQDILGQS